MLNSVSEIIEIIGRIGVLDNLSRFATLRKQNNLKSKETLRKNYLDPAINSGQIVLENPDKPTSKNQRYKKV